MYLWMYLLHILHVIGIRFQNKCLAKHFLRFVFWLDAFVLASHTVLVVHKCVYVCSVERWSCGRPGGGAAVSGCEWRSETSDSQPTQRGQAELRYVSHTDRETGSPLRLTHNLWSVNCEYNTLFLLPDSKEDSGFGSQSIGEEMGNPAVGNHWLSGSIHWDLALYLTFFRCKLVDCSSSQ